MISDEKYLISIQNYYCKVYFFTDCFCFWVCVRYVFASFFLILKEATVLTRKKKLFHFKSSLCSRKNQSLEFWIFEFHDFIKCPSIEKKRQTSNNVAGAAFNKEFHFTHASFMKIACLALHRYYQKQPLNRFWKKVLKKLEQIL